MQLYNQTRYSDELLEKHSDDPPSFSIHLHPEHWTLNNGSKFLYQGQIAAILDDIRAHRIPVDFMDLFDSAKVPFYEGCMLVELHDWRAQSKDQAGKPMADISRTLLLPDSESIYADILLANQKFADGKMTDSDALQFESGLVLAINPASSLCLDPNPELLRVVNKVSRVASLPPPKALKRKRPQLDQEATDLEDKDRRKRIMQFMAPRDRPSSRRISEYIVHKKLPGQAPPPHIQNLVVPLQPSTGGKYIAPMGSVPMPQQPMAQPPMQSMPPAPHSAYGVSQSPPTPVVSDPSLPKRKGRPPKKRLDNMPNTPAETHASSPAKTPQSAVTRTPTPQQQPPPSQPVQYRPPVVPQQATAAFQTPITPTQFLQQQQQQQRQQQQQQQHQQQQAVPRNIPPKPTNLAPNSGATQPPMQAMPPQAHQPAMQPQSQLAVPGAQPYPGQVSMGIPANMGHLTPQQQQQIYAAAYQNYMRQQQHAQQQHAQQQHAQQQAAVTQQLQQHQQQQQQTPGQSPHIPIQPQMHPQAPGQGQPPPPIRATPPAQQAQIPRPPPQVNPAVAMAMARNGSPMLKNQQQQVQQQPQQQRVAPGLMTPTATPPVASITPQQQQQQRMLQQHYANMNMTARYNGGHDATGQQMNRTAAPTDPQMYMRMYSAGMHPYYQQQLQPHQQQQQLAAMAAQQAAKQPQPAPPQA